jgi:hypothetical protein
MLPGIESARRLLLGAAVSAACLSLSACGGSARAPADAGDVAARTAAERRGILVSFDSFSEERMRASLPADAVPAIRRLFSAGACAAYAQPAFPSLTAPGHASLWTGAYGDVTGIAANAQPRLPWNAHTLLESVSGFGFQALRAEPLWVTAGRSGVSVVGHHVTQAPGPPGYPAVIEPPDDALLARRSESARFMAEPHVAVLNGYNRTLAGDSVLTERSAAPAPARGWRNLDALGPTVPPLEIAWRTGADSLFALLHGPRAYDRILVARVRDAAAGVRAIAAPPDTAPIAGRPLARFYSDPLPLTAEGGPARLVVRLFALAPDGSRFELFLPEAHVIEANHPGLAAAYAEAVGGWEGNAASGLLRRGDFGRTLANGGDGSAEARWLDGAEYATRQSIRGADWSWRTRRARLLLDYFSLGDETDHMLYGVVSPDGPPRDPALVAAAGKVRTRAWQLVDRRLAALQALVAGDSAALLLVSGDHGMRTTWRAFRINVALADAGLLAIDGNRIALDRTQALSPNGAWINVNDTRHRGGIVPPDSTDAVAARVMAALRDVRGTEGEPVVTGAWTAAELDSLGAGGPAGGDVYFELGPGYYASRDLRGPVTSMGAVMASHGFLSTAPDMHTVLCAFGDAAAPRRTGPARTIDAAPTIAEWIGMPAPRDARGRSRLGELLGR